MHTNRFPALRPNDRCGSCGTKVRRQVRLIPTSISCGRCGMEYLEDGRCTGYYNSGMTKDEWDYRQQQRERLEWQN